MSLEPKSKLTQQNVAKLEKFATGLCEFRGERVGGWDSCTWFLRGGARGIEGRCRGLEFLYVFVAQEMQKTKCLVHLTETDMFGAFAKHVLHTLPGRCIR